MKFWIAHGTKRKFAVFFLPFCFIAVSVAIAIITFGIQFRKTLQTYGVLPLLVSQSQPLLYPPSIGQAVSYDPGDESILGTSTDANRGRVVTATMKIVSPTLRPTLTPTLLPSFPVASCRQDCTSATCPTGLVCTAIVDDEGYYIYQCLNPSCSPSTQSDTCQCAGLVPSVSSQKRL